MKELFDVGISDGYHNRLENMRCRIESSIDITIYANLRGAASDVKALMLLAKTIGIEIQMPDGFYEYEYDPDFIDNGDDSESYDNGYQVGWDLAYDEAYEKVVALRKELLQKGKLSLAKNVLGELEALNFFYTPVTDEEAEMIMAQEQWQY